MGNSVADADVLDILNRRDEVTDLSRDQMVAFCGQRPVNADLQNLVFGAGRHHVDNIAFFNRPVNDPDERHDAAVLVVVGIEN